MVGDHVLFNGEEYVIVYKYSNDYCEIKGKRNPFNYQLVHLSELEEIHSILTIINDPK
jgi:hypothetical protein